MLVEPSANIRQAARLLREMYVALQEQAFTEEEATAIVSAMAMAMLGGPQ